MKKTEATFEKWWALQPITKSELSPVMILAFKEIAQKAFFAGADELLDVKLKLATEAPLDKP